MRAGPLLLVTFDRGPDDADQSAIGGLLQGRELAVAVIGVAFLLAGCGSDEAAPPSEQPSSPTSTASSELASPLEGTWRTAPMSSRDGEATLRRYGLAKWIKAFPRVLPLENDTVLILDLKEGEWDLYGKTGDGPRQEIDYDASYDVHGHEVDKVHSTGVTTYRWSVEGDTLTLEFLESTEPTVDGIPDEVFSRVLYMTRDFMKQG